MTKQAASRPAGLLPKPSGVPGQSVSETPDTGRHPAGCRCEGCSSEQKPIVIGIDSAELTGVAILEGDRLLKTGSIKIATWRDVERVCDSLEKYRPVLVAIEAPYIGVNGATALTLAVLLGRWLESFERRGVATLTVQASVWQLDVLKDRIVFKTKGPARKVACIAWARETFGVDLTADESDAAAIAVWAARHVPAPETPAEPQAPRTRAAAQPGDVP